MHVRINRRDVRCEISCLISTLFKVKLREARSRTVKASPKGKFNGNELSFSNFLVYKLRFYLVCSCVKVCKTFGTTPNGSRFSMEQETTNRCSAVSDRKNTTKTIGLRKTIKMWLPCVKIPESAPSLLAQSDRINEYKKEKFTQGYKNKYVGIIYIYEV